MKKVQAKAKIKKVDSLLEREIKGVLKIVNSNFEITDEIVQASEILETFLTAITEKTLDKIPADKIASANIKLSILNTNIGLKASEAVFEANMAYGFKKFEYASDWKPTKERISKAFGKVTNDDVEQEIVKKQWQTTKKEMELKLNADKLVALNKGLEGVMIALGYKLNSLRSEMINSHRQK
jgi:hypothetical protein